jgi:Protein of unknown function (DUF4065)
MATMVLDKEKYKDAFLYLLCALGKIEGKKKACKLFYFLDFDYYESYDIPFTGETYIAYPMGPYPQYFEPLAEEMQKEGLICIESIRKSPAHEHDTVVYMPLGSCTREWTDEERLMLDRIVQKYGGCTGGELESLSHEEAPYNIVELWQVIPYVYTFYRGTPDIPNADEEWEYEPLSVVTV